MLERVATGLFAGDAFDPGCSFRQVDAFPIRPAAAKFDSAACFLPSTPFAPSGTINVIRHGAVDVRGHSVWPPWPHERRAVPGDASATGNPATVKNKSVSHIFRRAWRTVYAANTAALNNCAM